MHTQTRTVMMNKHFRKLLQHGLTGMCLVVLAFGAAQAADDIPVEGSGMGLTEEQATKRALLSAVEQAVGVLTYSRNIIRNEEVVVDEINNLSNGFVKSFKKLEAGKDADGTWSVKVSAVVRSGNVANFLKRAGVETKVDLTNDWAQLTTGIKAKRDALALYEAKIAAIKNRLYTVELVDLKTGKPVTGLARPYIEEDLDGNANCLWAARIEPDLDFWNDCAHPLFKACFETLCVGSKTIRIKYTTSEREIKSLFYAYGANRSSGARPDTPPPFMDVKEPVLHYRNSPGFHPRIFGKQSRPYQGEYVFEGQGGLFGLILEKPIADLSSEVTFYFLTREVFTRLGLSKTSKPDIGWVLRGITDIGGRVPTKTDGGLWENRDNPDGIIGRPIDVGGVTISRAPIYFGPWFQPGSGSHGISSGQSKWPTWKDLSCYTRPASTGWSLNALHGGRMIPLSTNTGMAPHPFSKWMYQPIIFHMPIDDLRKVARVSVELNFGDGD